ncbi:hypothetical protein SBV1_2130007 [Verrucomicrobia bacterium]|nr:hypothetical protein SBV1_2130007 [Verrucomicrobiota bacterium]
MRNIEPLDITATDVTGQNVVNVNALDREMTVRELLESLVPRMRLPPMGNGGRPLTYQARLEREGRHLHSSEVVGEALQTSDRIMLQPTIEAGGC